MRERIQPVRWDRGPFRSERVGVVTATERRLRFEALQWETGKFVVAALVAMVLLVALAAVQFVDVPWYGATLATGLATVSVPRLRWRFAHRLVDRDATALEAGESALTIDAADVDAVTFESKRWLDGGGVLRVRTPDDTYRLRGPVSPLEAVASAFERRHQFV